MTRKTIVKKHMRRTKSGMTKVSRHRRGIPVVNTTPTRVKFKARSGVAASEIRRNEAHLRKEHPWEDADGDGIPNTKDCRPLDKNKQGKLHDLQVKLLERREERLEKKREAELKKLEDIKDKLNQKRGLAKGKLDIKKAKLLQKQSIIDEINREKNQLSKLKAENKRVKKELFKMSATGKVVGAAGKVGGATAAKSKQAIEATAAFLNKKSTRKTLKRLGKEFGL